MKPLIFLFFLAATTSLAAMGQNESVTTLEMKEQPRQFIAPGNGAAVHKNLQIPFRSITLPAKGQVIKSWTFTVFDSSGQKVWEQSKLETRDRGFWGEFLNLGERPQVEIPKELIWDGTYQVPSGSSNGKLVPDGSYIYQLAVTDSQGNKVQTPPFNVTVKNSGIKVDYIRVTQSVFSPVGQRPRVSIEQSSTREQRWEGQFFDQSGRLVRSIIWENPTPLQLNDLSAPDFYWDGKDQEGRTLADGDYFYTLKGTNRAGAVLIQKMEENLSIRSQAGLLKLSSDREIFSPLSDPSLDTLRFKAETSDPDSLTSWKLEIGAVNHPEMVVWSDQGTGKLPEAIVFDGKDKQGRALAEGRYLAVLKAEYRNGDQATSAGCPVELVLNPPRVVLSTNATVFGGEGRSGVTINLHGDPGVSWTLEILGKEGKTLRSYGMGNTGDASVEFQGMDENGKPLEDGPFTVKASGRNKAGLEGSALLPLRKDSRTFKTSLEISRTVVVPGHEAQGTIRLTPVLDSVDSVEKTSFFIIDQGGKTIAQTSAPTIVPFWDWNARLNDGKSISDGSFTARLVVDYANGSFQTADQVFRVDSQALNDQGPQVEMKLSAGRFIPGNIDGPQSVEISILATPGASPLAHWTLTALDERGKVFRSWDGVGIPPGKIVWDGKSNRGEVIESGEDYQLTLKVTDEKNRVTVRNNQVTADILVTKLGEGKYKIVISAIHFAGYSSDLFKVDGNLLEKNLQVLRRLAVVLNKLTEIPIRLEGYAVSELWNDPKSAAWEQETQLIPLSADRAQEVKNALVLLGVNSSRFQVKGFGAERPIVPHGDLEQRWKNRRVEFYLEKRP